MAWSESGESGHTPICSQEERNAVAIGRIAQSEAMRCIAALERAGAKACRARQVQAMAKLAGDTATAQELEAALKRLISAARG